MKVKKKSMKQRAFLARQRMNTYRTANLSTKTLLAKADYHQGNNIFGQAAGRECTCNVLQFLVTSQENCPSRWTTKDINNILHKGARSYRAMQTCSSTQATYFMTNELPGFVDSGKRIYTINKAEPLAGTLASNESLSGSGTYAIHDAILQGCSQHHGLFITVGSTTPSCTIGLLQTQGKYYVFDSHSRDNNGLFTPNGVAVLLEFSRIEEVTQHIQDLARSMCIPRDLFEVTPVTVKPLQSDTRGQVQKNPLFQYFTDQAERQRELNNANERKKNIRSNPLSAAKKRKEEVRSKEKLRKTAYRLKQSQEVTRLLQEKDKLRKLKSRKQQSVEIRKREGQKDKKRKLKSRKERSVETQERDAQNDRERKLKSRKERSVETQERDAQNDKERKLKSRKERSVETQEREAHKDKERKLKSRQKKPKEIRLGEAEKERKRIADLRSKLRSNRQQELRQKDKQRKATCRQRIPDELKKREIYKDKQRKQKCRKKRSDETQERDAKNDRERKLKSRKEKCAEIQKRDAQNDKERKLKSRKERSAEIQERDAQNDKERKLKSRQNKPTEIRQKEAEKERQRKASLRSKQRGNKQRELREKDKQRQSTYRKNKPKALQEKDAERDRIRKHKVRRPSSYDQVISTFLSHKNQAPLFVCTACHRQLYRESVFSFRSSSYNGNDSHIKKCTTGLKSYGGLEWICKTCSSYLKKGKMPPQAVINKLHVAEIPDELKELTELEGRLLAQRYPFMKILALPRGKQTGIKGAVVNVPVAVDKVCQSLPRTPSDAGIISLKLKRRLQYKGHVTYQNIRPNLIQLALEKLKSGNKLYSFVEANVNWEKECKEEDPEVWKQLTQEPEVTGDECEESENMETADDEKVGNETQECTDNGSSENEENEAHEMEEEETDPRDQLRGLKYDTCVQPTDLALSSDNIYSIAPGEGKKPIAIMMDDQCEEQAFPTLFPTGEFGFQVKRATKLSPKKYFNARLLNKDPRFARNIEYLFFAQYVTEYKQVMDNISVALRKARLSTDDGRRLTAGLMADPQHLNQIIFKDEAYNMLRTVRGSPPYWQSVLYKILAAVKQLGIFTWFLTLSAADLRWTDTLQTLGLQQGQRLSDDDISAMTWEQKCKLLASNPITAARHFDHRLQCLFRDVILSEVQPLGKVTNHMYRIEFQQRGSPHCHCVLWVDEAPKHDDKEENISTFIDQYVTCELPAPEDDQLMHDLVSTLQRHSHSPSCRKSGKSCRFNYPRPIASTTVVADTPDEDPKEKQRQINAATQTMSAVKDALEGKSKDRRTVREVLDDAKITESDYNKALQVNTQGKSIVYKRQPPEVTINTYNPMILRAWQANMDLQFVCNPYACIHYIISYVTKNEREMGLTLKEVSKSMANKDIKTKMKTVGSHFLNAREVSAQEAAYRVLGLPLHRSTFRTVFIQTDLPENRVVFLKPKSILENLDAESEDVYVQTLPQKYAYRPRTLENMTLAEFASWYVSTYKKNEEENEESNEFQPDLLDTSASMSTTIKLLDGRGYMSKCKKKCIIRYHQYSEMKEEEKFCHHMLMLYHPWRDEEKDLKNGHATYAAHYYSISDDINNKRSSLESHSDVIEHAISEMEELGPPQHAWDTLDTEAQQVNAEAQSEAPQDHPDFTHLQPSADHSQLQLDEISSGTSLPLGIEQKPTYLSNEQHKKDKQSLNSGQYKVFTYVHNWCVELMKSKRAKLELKPIYVCITGGAGTGKSHLISTIYQMAIRILKDERTNPEAVRILLTAPTGSAAFNIHASTLHSAFLLPLGQNKVYKKLSDEKRNTLRCKLANLDMLIIDEISMVGCDLFLTLDQRLREIKGTDKIFGGVSVLAFGDMYQLAPVCQRFVFEDTSDLFARLAGSLWKDNFQIAELSEIMRQKDDKEFAELLNRIRVGTHTSDDMNILQQRIVSTDDSDYPSNALHVYPTNAKVDQHNAKKLKNLQCPERRCIAVDRKPQCLEGYSTGTDARFTGGLPDVLELKEGARIMLTRNIDVTDGLVNGALGTVLGFAEHTPQKTNPKAVLIEFDEKSVGSALRQKCNFITTSKTAVPITPIDVKFSISAKKSGLEINRCQFPLKLCWATTIHKVQGLTVPDIVVSMKGRFGDGQCYVAVSRVPKLSGLHLLDFDESKIRASTSVKAEMQRMFTTMLLYNVFDDISLTLESRDDPTLIGLHNVRSLPSHYVDMKQVPCLQKCSVFCITETWLDGRHQTNSFVIPHYNQVRKDRSPVGNGGGICLYIKSSIMYRPYDIECKTSNVETMSVLIDTINNTLLLVTVYRSPKSSIQHFNEAFCNLLQQVKETKLPTLIIGDFNINLLVNKHSQAVEDKMHLCGFNQHVTKPTHSSGSLLDHVYSNFSTTIWQCAAHYSDHDIIWILPNN